ncbi:MAG: peptide ABC transporter substrate-binding protein [Anaerolineae bacterium]
MRAVRLPLIALALAAVVFAATLFYRATLQSPAPSPAPTQAAATSTMVPSGQVTLAVTPLSTLPLPTTARQGAYNEGLIGTVQRINPLLASLNPVDEALSSLIFEGLTSINEYGEPVPALADRWTISSDALEYVVFLREDVKWQDGTPFTAADVLYTTSLLSDPEFPGDPALGAFWRTVEVQQLSDYVVRFRLAQPLGSFLERLSIGLLPEHALRGTTASALASHPFNLAPIGTGPYQLSELRADSTGIREVELRVSPLYRERPEVNEQPFSLDPVHFTLFSSFESAQNGLAAGLVDALAASTPAERESLFVLSNNAGLEVYNQIENRLGVLLFNFQNDDKPYFRDQRTRVALQAALDPDALIERVMGNSAVRADSPIMPGSWAYEANMPWADYDPARARTLIEQAAERLERVNAANQEEPTAVPDSGQVAPGVDPTATPTPAPPPAVIFEFSILVPDDPVLTTLAQEIAAQWSQVGVVATVESVPLDVFRQRLDDGQFDTTIVEMGLGSSADPDVYDFWHQGQYPDGENLAGVDDRQLSILLERARRDPYGVNREQDYQQFQQEFADKAIAIPLYHPLFTYVSKPRVEGIQLGFIGRASDRFRNIGEWSLAN